MYDLEAVINLEKTFKHRSLCHHAKKQGVVISELKNKQQLHLVLDTHISQQILKSDCFEAFNIFQLGLQRLKQKQQEIDNLEYFFEHIPLFKNGAEHRAIKKDLTRLLSAELKKIKPFERTLIQHFSKRLACYSTGLAFATQFINVIFAKIISNLLNVPFLTSYRVMRRHKNIFLFYFHNVRHEKLNANLTYLVERLVDTDLTDSSKLVLAQSLIVMGRDPLVSAMTACFNDAKQTGLTNAAKQYCPVSEIKRRCVRNIQIAGIHFKKGDYVSLALVPAQDETDVADVSFGAGSHICIGQKISKWILALAQQIVAEHTFENKDRISSEGAFLLFD